MKERVAGARGQSADGNYRRQYGPGQSKPGKLCKRGGANSSEKRRLEGGSSGFWWFSIGAIREFSKKKQALCLVRGLHRYQVFEIKSLTRVLDLRMLGA